MTSTDELAVESSSNKDELYLLIEPFSVLQSPKLNGNWAYTADDSLLIAYEADTTPPLPDYMKFNNSIEKLVFRFTDVLALDVDFSKFTFAGLTFTSGDVQYGTDPSWLELSLTGDDIASIEALPDSVKASVEIDMQAGAFTNLENLTNEDLTFMDGDELTTGSESVIPLVGIGRDFWLISKEAFPTNDRQIPATIRKIGSHCVIYVADDQWQPYYYIDLFGEHITSNNGSIPLIPSEVDAVYEHFDNTAYDEVNAIFAEGKESLIPQTVTIFLCDIRDEYNLGRNDTKSTYFISSFFNSNDQYSEWQTGGDFNTNDLDMIYVDTWPQLYSESDSSWYIYDEGGSNEEWRVNYPSSFPVTVSNAVVNAYTKLLCYKVDPWESKWMVEGFASLAELMVEGEVSFYGAGAPISPTSNALKNFSTGLKTKLDFYNSYLYILYLYEKYGGLYLIKDLAVQPAVDMSAVEISFANLLADSLNPDTAWQQVYDDHYILWSTQTAQDVFSYYAMACLLDTTNMDSAAVHSDITGDEYKFQFDNVNLYGVVSSKNAAILKWDEAKGPPPYSINQQDWSFGYYYFYYNSPTSNPMLTDTSIIRILMPLSQLNVFQLLLKNDPVSENNNPYYYFEYFPYDSATNSAVFLVSPDSSWTPGIDPTDYRTQVIAVVLGGAAKITEEWVPPELALLSVAQSPIVSNRFDVYLLVSDLIWGDGSAGGDIPQIRYTYEGVTTSLLMQPYEFQQPFGYEEDFSLYASYLNFDAPGNYTIQAFFADLSGEEYYLGPYDFVVDVYTPGGGVQISLKGAEFNLEANCYPQPFNISVNTVNNNADAGEESGFLYSSNFFSAPPVTGREAIGPAYHIQPDIYLNEPASISLPYGDYIGGQSPADLGVYLYRGDEWVYLGGEPDPATQTIKVRAKQLGLMQLQAGSHGSIPSDLLVPDRYVLKQNYPNPFNPTTRIDYQLEKAGYTTLKVYDILGREVAVLMDGYQYTGFHSVSWDGRAKNGIPVASGVYFYTLDSGKYNKTCKMVLLK